MLKFGCRNDDVETLQILLTSLGYDTKGIDGIFGVNTKTALKKFQVDFYVDGVATDKVLTDISNLYNKKFTKDQNNDINSSNKGYKKIRMFDSDVHIYETSSDEFVDVTLGIEGKLEPLSKIDSPNKEEICKINGAFFNFDGSKEYLGMYINKGKLYQKPDNTFINFLYFKDGKTDIKYYDGNYEEIRYWLNELVWGIGCGWCLIKNGKVDTSGSSIFHHSSQRHPRTLLAKKKTGEFLLIVVDGRTKNSKGMNVLQCSQLLLELDVWNGCSLDGGGSSEMIVNNKIVNNLQYNSERKIGSAIVVYKK